MSETQEASLLTFVKTVSTQPGDLLVFTVPESYIGLMTGDPFMSLSDWMKERAVSALIIHDGMTVEKLTRADWERIKEQANG